MAIRDAIYLDYQATTPVDSRVLAEMIPYFGERFGNPHSANHYFGWQAADAVQQAAGGVARLIGADADEIVFTSGATEANNLALLGIGRRAVGGHRRRVLVSAIEHKCILTIARVLGEQLGYEVEQLPVDSEGRVRLPALEQALDSNVLLVSVMATNNEIGTIQDVEQIADLARSVGALFHCDAAQAPCAIDLHRIAEVVDLLSLSSYKMYGPMGVGALFIRRALQDQIEPIVYGGGQQGSLRSGTVPVALCVGMGAAATFLGTPEAAIERDELRYLRDRFVDKLKMLPWPLEMNGPHRERRHPGNANLRFVGFSAHEILNALQPRLAASTGSACTSGFPEASHVLRAIGLSASEAEASIRFSLGRGTTEEAVERSVLLIKKTLENLAGAGLKQLA